MKNVILNVICFCCFIVTSHAQTSEVDHEVDSLLQNLITAKEDTSKVKQLNHLSFVFWSAGYYEKAKKYADDAFQLAGKINYEKGQGIAYYNIGNILSYQGDYLSGRKNLIAYLKISERLGNKSNIANAYDRIGTTYLDEGNFSDALKNAYASLKIREEIGDKKNIEISYNNLGLILMKQGNYQDALKMHLSSLKICEEIGDKRGIISSKLNIATIYLEDQNNYSGALKIFNDVLKIAYEMGNKYVIANSLYSIGTAYEKQGNYSQALKNYFASMKIKQETGEKGDIWYNYIGIGNAYFFLKNFSESRKYLNDALSFAKETEDKNGYIYIYGSLATLDSAVGDYKQATEHLKLYILYSDSVLNETSKKQINEMSTKYESEKKDKAIIVLNKDKEIQNVEIKKQTLLKNSFIGGLAAVALLSLFGFNNFRVRNKLKLQTLRNKIAGDLHDDVGSTLSSIRIFSEMALEQTSEVTPMLHQISDSSRKMLDAMADIVWTINPENDQFEKIILRMRSFSYELLGAKKIDFEFNADEDVTKEKLPMDVRKNLYLIFKEATNNMVKYSEASKANFSITGAHNILTLLIRDNGKGFDVTNLTQGNGLKNMKRRAEEIAAKLLIESEIGKGTTVQLIVAV